MAKINFAGTQGIKNIDLKIMEKGIERLQENSFTAKAKDYLKTATEIIPGA